MRDYPALTLTWTRPVNDERVNLLLAELDGLDVTAVEELPDRGLRLFFNTAAARVRAAEHLGSHHDIRLSIQDVSDDDWGARSQAAITRIRAGALTIAPPWDVPTEVPSEGLIVIQPSMGFGTGHHASTRLCLQQLQSVNVRGADVLDVGTGSGVLAIAAAKLGGASVVGIDLDADALENASENVMANSAGAAVTLRELTLEAAASLGRRFDLILANLTGAHLIREAAHFSALAGPGARLVVSGFQTDEADTVTAAFEVEGWNFRSMSTELTWVAAVFTIPTRSTAPSE